MTVTCSVRAGVFLARASATLSNKSWALFLIFFQTYIKLSSPFLLFVWCVFCVPLSYVLPLSFLFTTSLFCSSFSFKKKNAQYLFNKLCSVPLPVLRFVSLPLLACIFIFHSLFLFFPVSYTGTVFLCLCHCPFACTCL